jgi:uncharacterized protein
MTAPAPTGRARQLALAVLFGLAFGFLLQRGGVTKYHVLMGVLLLEDFTVVKVMMSAVVVGMLGVHAMAHFGLVEVQPKPLRGLAVVVGGLVFGVGFGLLGYCPGTNAGALGQGNWDAGVGVLGLMAGSYAWAEVSDVLERRGVLRAGDRGVVTLPGLVRLRVRVFVPLFALLLAGGLFALEQLERAG